MTAADALGVVLVRQAVAVGPVLEEDDGTRAAARRGVRPGPVRLALWHLVRRARDRVKHVAQRVCGQQHMLRRPRYELVAPCQAVVHCHKQQRF